MNTSDVQVQNIEVINKPITLRVIFILNAFKIILSLGFYYVFTFTDLAPEGLADPTKILYTSFAYMVLFGVMVTSILKRSFWGLRLAIILDFLVSIPVVAVVGFVISIVSFGMTFTKSVKKYFGV